MAGEDRFEQRWLVVTAKRLMVLDPNGASGDVEFSLQAVKSARIEALVGGGRLELEREEGAPTHLYYSNSLASKFAEVAEGIEQLKEGQGPQPAPRAGPHALRAMRAPPARDRWDMPGLHRQIRYL